LHERQKNIRLKHTPQAKQLSVLNPEEHKCASKNQWTVRKVVMSNDEFPSKDMKKPQNSETSCMSADESTNSILVKKDVRSSVQGTPGQRKKKEEVEKTITQQVQERCRGLDATPEGRRILDRGARHQKLQREAFIKGDHALVERAELEAHRNEMQVCEFDAHEQPHDLQRSLERRHRFRVMNKLTTQVSDCRRQMANVFQLHRHGTPSQQDINMVPRRNHLG